MRIVFAIFVFTLSTAACAQGSSKAGGATLTYHYERVGLPVPLFNITINEDGSGTYTATYLPPETGHNGAGPVNPAAPTQKTASIVLSPATTAKLFEQVRSTNHFRGGCQSKAKNIANSGNRTLDYTGPDGHDTCAYSYTENKAIEALTTTFDAISSTMTYGRQLDFDHRFDRLGLDQHMMQLVASMQEGRSVEVQAIGPILRSIADDPQVIERVRLRAVKLLELPQLAR